MGVWIRVDANRHTHKMGRQLGAWGCIVVEAVWEIVKVHGRTGTVSSDCVSAESVSEWMRLDREDGEDWTPWVRKGLQRCYKHGALVDNGDGTVTVRDWKDYQIDQTAADRNKRHRARKSADMPPSDTVTPRNGRSVTDVTATGHNITGQGGECAPEEQELDLEDRMWRRWSAAYTKRYPWPPKVDVNQGRDRQRSRSIINRIVEVAKGRGAVLNDEGVLGAWDWVATQAVAELETDKCTLAYVEGVIDRWLLEGEEGP